ncbi:MAG: RecX family transcriptional regulator [Candidatus Dormibacteria bacterium]
MTGPFPWSPAERRPPAVEGAAPPQPTRGTGRRSPAPGNPGDVTAAEEVAVRVLVGAAQSAAGLRQRLVRHGFTAEAASAATATMVERGYVDDAAYAASIVSRRRRSGHGRLAVLAEMRRRALDGEVVAAAAATAGAEEERAAALEVAARLARGRRDPATREGQQRLAAALQRRGFEVTTVVWVLGQLAGVALDADLA